jgi:UDP-N-acetyl-D-glucosamine dehydrogenase
MEDRPAQGRTGGAGERVKYMTDYKAQLLAKFESREARIAIIGLGYVGLPLAVAFAESGYRVTGIDLDARKIDALNRGESYVEDVPAATVANLMERGLLTATTDYAALAVCDAVSICVPTPLGKTGDPDISYIVSASNEVARYLQPGMVVVLESTTYPGTTTEVLLPLLEGNGQNLRAGEDFFLAFSPERVDPGREDWTTHTTPKVIGGVTPACLQVAMAFYSSAIQTLVPVSSTEAAEMVKLLENTFRAVNIGLVNEVLLMADKLGLDVWEVIDAAATKPFGFMKFTPGPGLGGHCIPIDPLYLSWKLKTLNYTARFIELASEVNTNMPRYWVQKVQDALNDAGKPVKGSHILVLGVAYKKNVSDVRESPSLDIIHLLNEKGARVSYHDPHVPAFHHEGMEMVSVTDLDAALAASDCVVIATDHDAYDWARIRERAQLIVDTRRALHPVPAQAGAA